MQILLGPGYPPQNLAVKHNFNVNVAVVVLGAQLSGETF